jgi:uncharacterized phiE125 gp8 family phage protein
MKGSRTRFKISEKKPQDLFELEEVKHYLRISDSYDDKNLSILIEAAIENAENFINTALLFRKIELQIQNLDAESIKLRYAPVTKVSEVILSRESYRDRLSSEKYSYDEDNLYFISRLQGDNLLVEYCSGLETDKIPNTLRCGILTHIAEMYDRTYFKEGDRSVLFSKSVQNLYLPYRRLRI